MIGTKSSSLTPCSSTPMVWLCSQMTVLWWQTGYCARNNTCTALSPSTLSVACLQLVLLLCLTTVCLFMVPLQNNNRLVMLKAEIPGQYPQTFMLSTLPLRDSLDRTTLSHGKLKLPIGLALHETTGVICLVSLLPSCTLLCITRCCTADALAGHVYVSLSSCIKSVDLVTNLVSPVAGDCYTSGYRTAPLGSLVDGLFNRPVGLAFLAPSVLLVWPGAFIFLLPADMSMLFLWLFLCPLPLPAGCPCVLFATL